MYAPRENDESGGFEPLSNSDLIPIETEVSSPNPEVVEQINDGDILKVALQLSGNSTYVVVMHKGRVVGKIVTPAVEQLPEYIVRGTDYTATLISKGNGALRVRIKAIE